MDKNKIVITIIALVVIVFIIGYFRLNKAEVKNESGMILFYSTTCPHCKNVEKFINDNNIKEKIILEEREVGSSEDNSVLMQKKAKECGIKEDSLGVPFLWNGERCIMGDTPIIEYLKQI